MSPDPRLQTLVRRAVEAAAQAPAFARRLAEAGLSPEDLGRLGG